LGWVWRLPIRTRSRRPRELRGPIFNSEGRSRHSEGQSRHSVGTSCSGLERSISFARKDLQAKSSTARSLGPTTRVYWLSAVGSTSGWQWEPQVGGGSTPQWRDMNHPWRAQSRAAK
jgi:hypothetical protein